MEDAQLATDLIVIGILGASLSHDLSPEGRLFDLGKWIVIAALQGAFAEHQAILKKLSGKGKSRLETIEVRTPEELKRCDALIIPGGGTAGQISFLLSLFMARLAKPFALVGHIFPCVLTTPPMSLCPESTTIALLARLSGLMEPLREFVKTKSVWGTCAGAILLARAVSNPKIGGQELLGGVSVKIARNGWGSQVRRLCFSPYFLVGRTEMIN